MSTAKEALKDLCSKVNIKYYIGPKKAQLIEDACCKTKEAPKKPLGKPLKKAEG